MAEWRAGLHPVLDCAADAVGRGRDHEAQRRGILTRFCTLVDRRPDAPWTHMRLFEFANPAQRDALVPALATVVATLTPDPLARESRARLAVTLRDKMGEADFDLLD